MGKAAKKAAPKAAHTHKEPKAPQAQTPEEIAAAIKEQRENPGEHTHHDLNAVGPGTKVANKTHGQRTPGPAVTSQDGAISAQNDAERRAARKTTKLMVQLERDALDDNGKPRVGPLTCEVPEDQVDNFVNGWDHKTNLSYGWRIA